MPIINDETIRATATAGCVGGVAYSAFFVLLCSAKKTAVFPLRPGGDDNAVDAADFKKCAHPRSW